MDRKSGQRPYTKKGRVLPLLGVFLSFVLTVVFIGLVPTSNAQPGPGYGRQKSITPPKDERELVSMPEGVRQVLRQDMISNLMTIDQILGHLAEGDLDMAAEVAESKLGRGSMGKHRGTGMGPGRYMPSDMHDIGFSMHQAASNFAEIAKKKGDLKGIYGALQEVTSNCVACHLSYRIR